LHKPENSTKVDSTNCESLIPIEVINDAPQETIEVNISEIIKLQQLVDDYNQLRQVVLYNLKKLNGMSEQVENELGFEFDPKLVDAWNSIIKSSNDSLKILTESYKNISSVLLNVHKVNSLAPKPKTNDEIKIENTSEVIKRLKNGSNP
jgi:hypothetical protein